MTKTILKNKIWHVKIVVMDKRLPPITIKFYQQSYLTNTD